VQRIIVTVSDTSHSLAHDQNIEVIEAAALAALRRGGDVVKVTLHGNRELSILVSPGVPITFVLAEVPDETRDNGDLRSPFEPFSDWEEYLE